MSLFANPNLNALGYLLLTKDRSNKEDYAENMNLFLAAVKN